jgi:hypothetical protein
MYVTRLPNENFVVMEKLQIENGAGLFRIGGGVGRVTISRKMVVSRKNINISTGSPLLKTAQWNNITLA